MTTFLSSPDEQFFSAFSIHIRRGKKKNKELIQSFFNFENQLIKALRLDLVLNSNIQFEKILKTQSESLRELSLVLDTKHGATYVNNGTEESFPDFKLEKLVNLSIEYNSSACQGFRKKPLQNAHISILETLFSKIPRGKAIKLSLIHWSSIEATIPLLEKFNQIQNLKALEVERMCCVVLKKNELKSLSDAGVQLQTLDLNPSPHYCGDGPLNEDYIHSNKGRLGLELTQEISQFICAQANTLEILSWGSRWNFKFPNRMPALKKLRLSCEGSPSSSDSEVKYWGTPFNGMQRNHVDWVKSCPPICYGDMFPQLETFHLTLDKYFSEQDFLHWVRRFNITSILINFEVNSTIHFA